MARKTLAKKNQDIFQRAVMGLFDQLSGAGMLISIFLLGSLVVLAVLWGLSASRERAAAEAWDGLARAMEIQETDEQVKALEDLLKTSAITPARHTAALVLAASLHDKALLDPAVGSVRRAELLKRARELYEEILREEPDHSLVMKARANLARVLEDAGSHQEAYDAFGRAAQACQDTDFSFLQGEMLWGQARCALALKHPEEAFSLLESAMSRGFIGEGGGWKQAAHQMHNELRKAGRKSLLVEGTTQDAPAPDEEKPADGEPAPDKPSGSG